MVLGQHLNPQRNTRLFGSDRYFLETKLSDRVFAPDVMVTRAAVDMVS